MRPSRVRSSRLRLLLGALLVALVPLSCAAIAADPNNPSFGGGGNLNVPPTPNFDIPQFDGGAPFVQNQIVATFPGTAPRQIGEDFAATHRAVVVDYYQMAGLGLHVFLLASNDTRPFDQVFDGMARDGRALWVQPNLTFATSQSSAAIGGIGDSAGQYALDRMRVAPLLDATRGEGIRIAMVDSGVGIGHEALAGARIATLDVTQKGEARTGKHVAEVHGTAIAGIIVGHGKLHGASPEAELLAVRAFKQTDSRTGAATSSSFHLSKGISAAVDRDARVLNLSLAGPQDRLVTHVVEQALLRKIVVIAAAGNAGPGSPPAYPAAQPGVIAVTATDGKDRLYRDANRGSYVTLAAPGVDILVAKPSSGYGYLSGTSMATAYVSGVSALLIARATDLTPPRLRKLLESTAIDLGSPQRDPEFGAGRVDAGAAFSHLAAN
jgi:subtilisin family serine protease